MSVYATVESVTDVVCSVSIFISRIGMQTCSLDLLYDSECSTAHILNGKVSLASIRPDFNYPYFMQSERPGNIREN